MTKINVELHPFELNAILFLIEETMANCKNSEQVFLSRHPGFRKQQFQLLNDAASRLRATTEEPLKVTQK